MKSRYLFLFLVAILSLPLQLWAQNEVLSVPLENIQPYDPFQPLQQMYCDTRGNSLGTNLQEWQVPSNLRWDDPNRDRSHVCWVDCNGQIHCNTPCSSAFSSGCGGGTPSVNWYVNDVLVGTEPGGSFNDGTNTTWFGTDDATNHRVNLHVNATGGGSGACSVGSVEDGYVCAGPPLLAPLAPPILDKAFAYSPGTGLTTISATLPQPVNVGDQILVGCLVDSYPSPGGSCLPSGSASSLTDSAGDTYSLIGPAHALVYTNVQFAIATVGTAGSMTVTMAGLSSSNAYELAIFRTYNVGGFDTYASGGGSYTNTATANITTTSAGDLLIGVGAQLSGFAYGPLMIYQNSGNWAELGISTPLLSYGEGWGFSGTYQSAAGANSLTWSSTPSSGPTAGMGVGIFAFSPGGAWPSTGPPTFRSLYATDIPTTLWLTDLDILPTLFLYLPACTSGSLGTEGTIRSVTDSTTATQGAIITGGGTNHVQAYCNGTNWVVTSGTGGGGSVELQTIGTDNSSQVLLNFIASTTNTLGLINTPANPSGGEEKIEVTGATGLTSDEGKLLGVNSAGTVGLNAPSAYSIPLYTGSVTPGHCAEWSASSPPTLEDSSGACGGSGGSVEIQTIGTDNSSQALLNFITSTVNAVGFTITPSNPSGGEEQFEITGNYLGSAQVPQCDADGTSGGVAYACTVTQTSPDAVILYPDAANTGSFATLNVNSTTACQVYEFGGTNSTLNPGDIAYPGGTAYLMLYTLGPDSSCKWIISSQVSGGSGGFPTLNQVLDPTANKDFSMGGYYLALDGGNFGAGDAPALSVDVDANRAPFITAPVFTAGSGSGLNNATFSGTPVLPVRQFCVTIDSLGGDGGPDTFSWGVAGSCTSGATAVPITALPQSLTSGVSVTFAYGGPPYQGHSLGDQWTVTSSPGGIINAATGFQIGYTAPDGDCLVGLNGVYQPGSCGGSGGSPGAPDNSLQYRIDASTFGGIPGSVVDGTNGLVSLSSSTSVGTTLTVTGAPAEDAVDLFSSGNESSGTLLAQSNSASAPGVFSLAGQFYATAVDNSGAGLGVAAATFTAILYGSDVAGDTLQAVAVNSSASAATGGNPIQIEGIYIGNSGAAAGFPSEEVAGIHIGNQNFNASPATSVNAGILIDSQTADPNVYAIKTSAGPVDFGDIVSPGINTLGWGIPSIATPALITFTGSGLNDLVTGGFSLAPSAETICVKIDGTAPDTFEWGTDPTCTTFTGGTLVPFTGSLQLLANGVMISGAITGHTLGDHWTFAVLASPGDGYEFNASDADTPVTEGATCTNTGDHAGGRAIYLRGDIKCF